MSPVRFLEEKLKKGHMVLLDGATGTELEHRGVPMNSAAWSVEAVYSHPDVVQDIHEDYIRAGVDIITVNSFSMGRHMLISAGLADDFRQLNRSAVELAIRARDRTATAPVAIAGSVAPTTFCCESAKCYPPLTKALSWYTEQAEVLVESGVDILIVEMIEDLEQGSLAVQAAGSTGLPVWLGFSCRRGDSGEIMLWEQGHTLAEGIRVVSAFGGSAAFIMHTEVVDAADAFSILKTCGPETLGVYAHSGTFVMPSWKFSDIISPEEYAQAAGVWIQMGAKIIGGCCGIGPAHIRELQQRYCR